ncbi:MAG: Rieske 2Fe-2S domain-containing protein [Hyphomicrobium sp.]|uniref:Rieske 2Fe-2S domain-containing protein n=1 Tax=Hyphomicrobium sp. TaxID=82 RepID=UPI003D0F8B83
MNEQRDYAGYTGYQQTDRPEHDRELTEVGPRTPGGEYLRRFWHPVAIAPEIGDLPKRLRVLGEDLVCFRDKGGRYGLLHLNCCHRQTSLEYGICEDRGIRCCYHGWLFDVDGKILETPGEAADSKGAEKVRATRRQGAYPVREHKGLIFAYMGPSAEIPAFPIYDAYEIPGMTMTPYISHFPCNWLQVLDAIVDPVHTSFLHSRVSRLQFSEGFGELGEIEFYDQGIRLFATNTRRVGDNVWIRVNELIFPNFTQAGAAYAADGTRQRYFGRSSFTRWVVPVDDTDTRVIAWANFGERGDPHEWNTPEGIDQIEQGEVFDRPYEQRQRHPGDLEATTGMGPVTIHKLEHLMATDKGVAALRRKLRRYIKRVAAGEEAEQPTDLATGPIPTYGGDTVMTVPARNSIPDGELRRRVAAKAMEHQFAADKLVGEERDRYVIERLKALEIETRDW